MKKKQVGTRLQFDDLQEVLDASPETAHLGASQFETPEDIAAALAIPLTQYRGAITDLQCGHGNLLRGVQNDTTSKRMGIDISPSSRDSKYTTIIGDINEVYRLLALAKAKFDLLVLNPPFSLKWPDPWHEPGSSKPAPVIDSSLATFRMAITLLSPNGEGFMICNGNTADKLKFCNHPAVWLRVDLPNFFPDTLADIPIAVLYFHARRRRDPDSPPQRERIDSIVPLVVAQRLKQVASSRSTLMGGKTVKSDWDGDRESFDKFDAVREEWRRLENEKKGKLEYNISLGPDGTIHRYLTTFQRFSGSVPKELVMEFNGLHGRNPMELVVQRTTRNALQRAMAGGIWRVDPALVRAVDRAVMDYNAVRAPFIELNDVQRLGFLDEDDAIRCKVNFGSGFTAGQLYAITTETFEGKKVETRKRANKPPENIVVSGFELLIKIIDGFGRSHVFTQFPLADDLEFDKRTYKENHPLQELVDHFHIPSVPDVATTNPEKFEEYRRRLLALET